MDKRKVFVGGRRDQQGCALVVRYWEMEGSMADSACRAAFRTDTSTALRFHCPIPASSDELLAIITLAQEYPLQLAAPMCTRI